MSLITMIQSGIRKQGWDALWVASRANTYYISGFTGTAGWLFIPSRGKGILITDGRYAEQAGKESPDFTLSECRQDPCSCLAGWISKKRVGTLGFEDDQVVVRDWQKITKNHTSLEGFSASRFLDYFRAVKSPQELAWLRRAIRIAELAYQRVLPRIKPGQREIDIAARLEQAMGELGSQRPAFETIVASGARASLPHAKPTTKRLRPGELLVMDFGAVYRGYHSDLTRTVAIARMTPRQQDYYKIVKNAQKSAKKLLVSGQMAADSDRKCREVLKAAGLEEHYVHSLGHGIGLEIHESPKLSTLSKDRLEAGMTVTCEPGIYIPGWGGIRIEDDILVESASSRWLSQSPDTLQLIR